MGVASASEPVIEQSKATGRVELVVVETREMEEEKEDGEKRRRRGRKEERRTSHVKVGGAVVCKPKPATDALLASAGGHPHRDLR
jgi:hypothetical protein